MATKSIYKSRMPFKGVFGFFCGEHMAITIPETEPLEFYSGTTVKWKRTDLTDYPAPTLDEIKYNKQNRKIAADQQSFLFMDTFLFFR